MRLLDAYCGAGGAAAGCARAGFDEIVGVDLHAQPRYPFEFHQGDAIEFIAAHGHEFDAVHTSPPCPRYSVATPARTRDSHPDLVDATRDALVDLGRPWVIENVPGAPLRNPLLLCGAMFGLQTHDHDGRLLQLRRHRLFESSEWLMAPGGHHHPSGVQVAGAYGGGSRMSSREKGGSRGGYVPAAAVVRRLLDVPWMTRDEVAQCVPPAYTEWIGAQLVDVLQR